MPQALRSRPKIGIPNPVGWLVAICLIIQEVVPMLRFWMGVQTVLLAEQKEIRAPLVWPLWWMVVIASAFWALESPWVDDPAHAFRRLSILAFSHWFH
jgi:hypothetical protein